MMYWETFQRRKIKETKRGRGHSVGWTSPHTHRPDPAGEAYSRSEWALKTNGRSVEKQMLLLGEFSSYSECGGWGQKVGQSAL